MFVFIKLTTSITCSLHRVNLVKTAIQVSPELKGLKEMRVATEVLESKGLKVRKVLLAKEGLLV